MQLDNGKQPLDPAVVVIAPDYRWLLAPACKQAGETVTLDWLVPELGGVQTAAVVLTPTGRST